MRNFGLFLFFLSLVGSSAALAERLLTDKEHAAAEKRYLDAQPKPPYSPSKKQSRVALDGILGKLIISKDIPEKIQIQVPEDIRELVAARLQASGVDEMKDGVLTG